MSTPTRAWPPLIESAPLPAWMKWRDALLTLLMWIVFVVLLQRQFTLLSGSDSSNASLWEFRALLRPYVLLALALSLFLLIAAGFTMRRRWRSAIVPEPKPLGLAAQADRAGIDTASLAALRSARIVVVSVGDEGRLEIEGR